MSTAKVATNVECQCSMPVLNVTVAWKCWMPNMGQQMGCMCLDRLHMAAQGVPMAAHGVHMAAQRLLLGALGLHMAVQRLHMAAHGVHMAAQRLHLAAHGAAFGCRVVAF